MQLIYSKDNEYFTSKVYKKDDVAIKHVWPKTEEAYERLTKEFTIVGFIESPYFVDYLWADLSDYYQVTTRWIDQNPVTDIPLFIEGLENALDDLKKHEIRHRDIWFKNILIKDNAPILIDFGWAISANETDRLDNLLPYADDDQSMKNLIEQVKKCQ